MSRIAAAFAAARGATGLVPYVTAGYPAPETTLELLERFDALGARAIELGIPFSDPIADGPELQRAAEWAVRGGIGALETLEIARAFRARASAPLVVMTYANPVLAFGVDRFAVAAAEAGVDGVILSDLPPDEAPDAWAALERAGLDTVVLVAPTTPAARLGLLLARCRGFVYCLARTGVTGTGAGYAGSLTERIAALRARTTLPVAVGFGISTPEEARALRGVADAVVVGAALARAIREDPSRGVAARVESLARAIIAALA